MASIYELERQLEDAKRELNRLQSYYDYYEKSSEDLTQGDGITTRHTGRRGTPEQIEAAKEKVERLERQIKSAQEWEKDAPARAAHDKEIADYRQKREEEKKQRDKEQAERDKKHAQLVYKKLKKRYSNLGGFARLSNRLQGKTPNWKVVRELSAKELDFLLDVGYGNTEEQKKYDGHISAHDKKGKKARDERNIEKMRQMMRVNAKLKDAMKREDEMTHGRRY